MSLAAITSLLQSALLVLAAASAQPALPQASQDAAAALARQAIVEARQALSAGVLDVEVLPMKQLVERPENGGYATDGKDVYYHGRLVAGANPRSFVFIVNGSRAFGKDDRGVYWGDDLVLGANPKTFVVLKGDYGRDESNVYVGSQIMPGVDPLTFVAP